MSVELLGVSLSNVGLREALIRTNQFLKSGKLNTIAYASVSKLMEASEKEEQRQWWSALDMTICEDVEVLKAIGMATVGRIKEVEENAYLKEFLKLLVRGHKEIYLLADTEQNLQEFEEELRNFQNNLYIVGRDTLENYGENKDGMINAINAVAPKVILSLLPYPQGIHLMYDYRMYLNGSVWLSLTEKNLGQKKQSWISKIAECIDKKLFEKKISHNREE